MQDEVARDIAGEIRVKLTARERERFVTARPIDPEAYQLYLQALYHHNKRTEEDNQAAIEYSQAAIRKDPDYAPAYATLAMALLRRICCLSPRHRRVLASR